MQPSCITIDQDSLADFCRVHGVAKLSLFGSALRDDFDPDRSDIDLIVEFEPGVSRSLFKLVRMQGELGLLFGREVEITTPGSLSKYFRSEVLSAAVVLYDAE